MAPLVALPSRLCRLRRCTTWETHWLAPVSSTRRSGTFSKCSVALCRRLGPARAALGLVGRRRRPPVTRAPGAERRRLHRGGGAPAQGSGDVQVLVSALCGQACLAALRPPTDLRGRGGRQAEARRPPLAPHRTCCRSSSSRPDGSRSLRGDRAAAADHARPRSLRRPRRAGSGPARGRPRARVRAGGRSARAREALPEALSIWSAGGAGPAVARVEVLIGRLPDADGTERSPRARRRAQPPAPRGSARRAGGPRPRPRGLPSRRGPGPLRRHRGGPPRCRYLPGDRDRRGRS